MFAAYVHNDKLREGVVDVAVGSVVVGSAPALVGSVVVAAEAVVDPASAGTVEVEAGDKLVPALAPEIEPA